MFATNMHGVMHITGRPSLAIHKHSLSFCQTYSCTPRQSSFFCRRRQTTTVAFSSYSHDIDGRTLTIIHFNDVYDISPRKIEPVGGASRFTQLVKSCCSPGKEHPLILFSGDCLNPSLLSAFTRGEQMIPVLNHIGVHAALVGNHDFDFGVQNLESCMAQWKFPWLLTNVLDSETGRPLAGAHARRVLEWQGLKIGLIGIVEQEWLLTIPSIDCSKDIIYLDFIEEARKQAQILLHQDKVDIVIALTHMRGPNDERLASEVEEIGCILGGHDHDYIISQSVPHGTYIIKSGTDFREFSLIRLVLPAQGSMHENPYHRPLSVTWERKEVTSDVPEDAEVSQIVEKYQNLMGTRMDQPLGRSFVDIDTRFDAVRSSETNCGNLFADIMRLGLDADAAFLNGGTIRSDQIHSAGRLCMRDFVSMLPFTDELVVLRLTGQGVLEALENGVSSWPKREGRFLQVSGIKFSFDPNKPPGSRVDPALVTVGGKPLELEASYRVATKAYLRSGKDGFESLLSAPLEVDGETAPRLATLVHYLLTRIEELNNAQGANTDQSDDNSEDAIIHMRQNTNNNDTLVINNQSRGAMRDRVLNAVECAPVAPSPCAHGLDVLYYYDQLSGQFGIAPRVEGRIVIVQHTSGEDEGEATLAAQEEAPRQRYF